MPLQQDRRGANFKDQNLSNQDFSGTDFGPRTDTSSLPSGDRLIRSDFTNAILKETCLDRVQASRALFDSTDLSGASAVGADFTQIFAPNALFIDMDLTNADFSGSILDGADFTGSITAGANFSQARTLNVVGLILDAEKKG